MRFSQVAVVACLGGAVNAQELVPGPDYYTRQKIKYITYTIDTPIDHFHNISRYEPHTNATFKQRYWFDDSYYKPGGPVLLVLGGEVDATGDWHYMQTGITQILMEATNGLGVILENRYYGKSFPFNTSSTDELRFLTTEQTIADNRHFALHASFPGVANTSSLHAPNTPWILYGGSLPGAQTAFTVKTYGGDKGIIWGGFAGSGTTKAVLEYPQWYDPIQKYGPQDCVGSINGIVENIDHIFDSGDRNAARQLKSLFGLQDLVDADFAATIAFPLGGPMNYPTNTWQELNWNPDFGSNDFWLFCSNITNLSAPKNITSIDTALANYTNGKPWINLGNYANYIKQYIIPICDGAPIASSDCFGTQNQSHYSDVTNSNERTYLYSTCTESGTYQAAWPKGHGPNLLSRAVTVNYTQQWCDWAFPPGKYNSIPSTPDLARYNKYGGYSVIADRLAHVDGDQDVWNDLCYHAPQAGRRRTLSQADALLHPQMLISGGGHHWETVGICNVTGEPQFIRNTHLWQIRIVKEWLEEFQNQKNYKRSEL